MCRNIKTLFNFEPATEEEIRAASLQFVRKLSGFNKPSQANEAKPRKPASADGSASDKRRGSWASIDERRPDVCIREG